MDIFSQTAFVILFPVLLFGIITAGFIALKSKQINSSELQDKIDAFIEWLRKLLYLDFRNKK